MGADGIRVTEPGDLRDAYAGAIASGRPTVVEVMVDPEILAEPFRRDALAYPKRFLDRYADLDVAKFRKAVQ
jgi:thiamine pyrophosphate-dependent acetolactate synthase large subunit-like protein